MARTLSICTLIIASIILVTPSVYAADAQSQTLTLSLEAPNLDGAGPDSSTTETSHSSQAADTSKHKQSSAGDGVKIGQVGVVQTDKAAIYRTKSAGGHKYSTVKTETPLAIVRDQGDWYGVLMSNGKIGWVQKANVKLIGYELIAKESAPLRGGTASRGGPISRLGADVSDVIRTAEKYYGVRYVFGGTSPSSGMDCSAFVRSVFSQHGINLPRTAREQAQVGDLVSPDQLQAGDRLYFSCKNPYIDHCGIYAGNGLFIHCSASRNGIGVDSITSGYYSKHLITVRRS